MNTYVVTRNGPRDYSINVNEFWAKDTKTIWGAKYWIRRDKKRRRDYADPKTVYTTKG